MLYRSYNIKIWLRSLTLTGSKSSTYFDGLSKLPDFIENIYKIAPL